MKVPTIYLTHKNEKKSNVGQQEIKEKNKQQQQQQKTTHTH